MASIFEYILNQGNPTKRHCLSPRFLYYNVSDKNDDGTIIDKGSSFYDSIHVLGKLGICEENLCPYDDKFNTSPSDEAKEDALSRLVTKAENVNISHRDLTAALTEGYPIGISLKVYDSFGKNQKGFIFRPTDKELKSSDFGYHAMVVCGYSEKEKVYIVRNSWGEAFGDKGYCYIPFSYIEDKNLCRQACIVTGVNCGDIKGITTGVPKFDIENKDVEYAVLRILIDEEKQQIKQYRADFNDCYRGYMTLLGELTNKGKRDAIMNHALGKIKPEMTTQDVIETRQVSTNKPLFMALGLIIAALCCIALPKEQKSAGTLVPLIISALLWWKYPSTKMIEGTKTIEIPVASVDSVSIELKFLFAGRLIDSFNKVRNSLSDKHKYLQSYILNLGTWLNEERRSLNGMDEHIRKPFYSLFSNEQANGFLSLQSNKYLDDMWLYKRFADYDITDNAIISFKNMLYNELKGKTSSISYGFSMYDYIANTEKYDYLPKKGADRIFTTIVNMSVPFVQGNLHPHPKQILLCFVDPAEQDNWQKLLGTKYTTSPALANDTSTQKITFIQIQKYKLSETLYGD